MPYCGVTSVNRFKIAYERCKHAKTFACGALVQPPAGESGGGFSRLKLSTRQKAELGLAPKAAPSRLGSKKIAIYSEVAQSV